MTAVHEYIMVYPNDLVLSMPLVQRLLNTNGLTTTQMSKANLSEIMIYKKASDEMAALCRCLYTTVVTDYVKSGRLSDIWNNQQGHIFIL